MANHYTQNQQWNQNQMHFDHLRLDQDYEFNDPQQQQLDQQSFVPVDPAYQYAQQQLPPNPTPNSSSLHGAFAVPQNLQQGQGHPNSFATPGTQNVPGAFGHGAYGAQQNISTAPANRSAAPYRTAPTNFNFSSVSAQMQENGPTNMTSTFLTTSPTRQAHTQASSSTPQSSYYQLPSDDRKLPQAKRHHGQAFKEDLNQEDQEGEAGQDPKDGQKSKL